MDPWHHSHICDESSLACFSPNGRKQFWCLKHKTGHRVEIWQEELVIRLQDQLAAGHQWERHTCNRWQGPCHKVHLSRAEERHARWPRFCWSNALIRHQTLPNEPREPHVQHTGQTYKRRRAFQLQVPGWHGCSTEEAPSPAPRPATGPGAQLCARPPTLPGPAHGPRPQAPGPAECWGAGQERGTAASSLPAPAPREHTALRTASRGVDALREGVLTRVLWREK